MGSKPWSYSRLQCYKDCGIKYYFNYVQKLEPQEAIEEQHHANFGSAVHEALEVYYKGGSRGEIEEAFKKSYPEQLDKTDLAKTQENGLLLIKGYIDRYHSEDKNYKILATEVLDEFEIGGEKFVAKMDLIFEDQRYGGIYGMDHKTTSKGLDYKYFNQFEPNSQLDIYYNYMIKKYGECSGIYINAMQFGFRQRKSKYGPAGFHYKFDRQLFNRSNEQLKAEENDIGYWVDRINTSSNRGLWGRNTSTCRFCQFRPICQAGWTWEQDKDLILLQYKQRDTKDAESSKEENNVSSSK